MAMVLSAGNANEIGIHLTSKDALSAQRMQFVPVVQSKARI